MFNDESIDRVGDQIMIPQSLIFQLNSKHFPSFKYFESKSTSYFSLRYLMNLNYCGNKTLIDLYFHKKLLNPCIVSYKIDFYSYLLLTLNNIFIPKFHFWGDHTMCDWLKYNAHSELGKSSDMISANIHWYTTIYLVFLFNVQTLYLYYYWQYD